jgi:hypothetical protein
MIVEDSRFPDPHTAVPARAEKPIIRRVGEVNNEERRFLIILITVL